LECIRTLNKILLKFAG